MTQEQHSLDRTQVTHGRTFMKLASMAATSDLCVQPAQQQMVLTCTSSASGTAQYMHAYMHGTHAERMDTRSVSSSFLHFGTYCLSECYLRVSDPHASAAHRHVLQAPSLFLCVESDRSESQMDAMTHHCHMSASVFSTSPCT